MPATSKSPVLVAGVDGCKVGWLCFTFDLHSRETAIRVFLDFAELLGQSPRLSVVAVDIPIGLTEKGPRTCDVEARKLLRPLRGSSVFPAPVRAVLAAKNYEQACELSSAAYGKKISKQTFAIVPKIREVDACMKPGLQSLIREIHPELCFYALNSNHPMKHRKRSPDGHRERIDLLSPIFPALVGERLSQLLTRKADGPLIKFPSRELLLARYSSSSSPSSLAVLVTPFSLHHNHLAAFPPSEPLLTHMLR